MTQSEELEAPRGRTRSTLVLVAKSAARAAALFATYAAVGTVFHWGAFVFVAADVWRGVNIGPGPAHAPALVPLFLLILLFTPSGAVTAAYLFGLPLVCVLLGKRAAIHAAANRVLRDRAEALVELVVDIVARAFSSSVDQSGTVRQRLRRALDTLEGSRFTRFLLRATVMALKLPDVLGAIDFARRVHDEPDAARAELARAVAPRIAELAVKPSFRPLLYVLAFTTAVTLAHGLWTPRLH